MVHSGIQFIMFWSLFWGKLSLVLNLKNNFQTDKFPPETSYKKQTKNSFAWKSSQVSLTRISHKLFGVDKFKVILVICYCTSPFTQWQIMDIPATLPSQPTCYSSLRFCFSGRHFQGWFFFFNQNIITKRICSWFLRTLQMKLSATTLSTTTMTNKQNLAVCFLSLKD